MHKSYEELCALAATGQITGDAMRMLDQHIKECSSCRAFLEDLVPLKAHVTPVVAGSRTHSYTPPDGIRERFLQRAAAVGLSLTPGPAIEIAESSEIAFEQPRRESRTGFFHWFATPRFAVPALACVLCGVLGFTVARYTARPWQMQLVAAPPVQFPKVDRTEGTAQVVALQRQNEDANRRVTALVAALASAQVEKKQLEQQLARLAQRAADPDEFQQRFGEVSRQLEDASARSAKLQSDLDSERNRAITAEAVLVAQQKATEDADTKVATLESQLDQLRNLEFGKSMAGDLISARNLHIVDVYDTEANGSRKRAFGRVFYVEGKSLVFYAYDLPNSERGNKKIEFRVWGEQAGVNTISINLGDMHTDNSNEGRWILTCSDPKVLNRINAVYLTVDSNARHDSQPRGPKLMYAFLGSPNHP
jgi:hypothetical protein